MKYTFAQMAWRMNDWTTTTAVADNCTGLYIFLAKNAFASIDIRSKTNRYNMPGFWNVREDTAINFEKHVQIKYLVITLEEKPEAHNRNYKQNKQNTRRLLPFLPIHSIKPSFQNINLHLHSESRHNLCHFHLGQHQKNTSIKDKSHTKRIPKKNHICPVVCNKPPTKKRTKNWNDKRIHEENHKEDVSKRSRQS